ncbi:hypothetical protein NPIL_401871 [Nephila pilipes]|uniref:Uncharacterized protein n=1 Tax=Nephila pilipes TaxID=299642 RepID=A0A8X6Q4U8_NEPPI|nr:hypothetical protein NPIL_401871 [Nephila pilipes]
MGFVCSYCRLSERLYQWLFSRMDNIYRVITCHVVEYFPNGSCQTSELQITFKDIRTILKSRKFLFYEVGVLATGIGIGFVYSFVGWFVISIASYAKKSSTPGAEATIQSVVASTYQGLGTGIGNILAGVGFDYIGTK